MLKEALEISGVSFASESIESVGWVSRFLGDSDPNLVVEIDFDSVESNHAEVHIDRRLSQQLRKNHRTDKIQKLSFRYAVIANDANCFFATWNNLRSLEIRDTIFPETWSQEISRLSNLEHVVISGGSCNLQPEAFAGCKSLKVLKLANRGIDSTRLGELKRLLPDVEILLLASFDEPFEFDEDQGSLSAHDPAAFASMKSSLDRLHATLGSLDPPARNQFCPPATEVQIAAFEHQFGVPLHPSLRALFEIHNGQPDRSDELVIFDKLLSLDESEGNMDIERDASFEDIEIGFNFNPEYDWMNNPCLVGIGSSEADVTYVNNVTGHVYYSMEGLYFTFPKLEDYFDAITKELEAGRYESDEEGNVCLSGHMTEISKQWREQSSTKPTE